VDGVCVGDVPCATIKRNLGGKKKRRRQNVIEFSMEGTEEPTTRGNISKEGV
jgi:hypothetical protein